MFVQVLVVEFDLFELDFLVAKLSKFRLNLHTFFDLTGRLKPRKAPRSTSGVDTQNHKASNAINVVNGIAAELPFTQRTIFKIKKILKIRLKTKTIQFIFINQLFKSIIPRTCNSCQKNIFLPIVSTKHYQIH